MGDMVGIDVRGGLGRYRGVKEAELGTVAAAWWCRGVSATCEFKMSKINQTYNKYYMTSLTSLFEDGVIATEGSCNCGGGGGFLLDLLIA